MHKLRSLTIGLTTLAFAAVPATADARDYYVSPSGSDSAPGTVSAPWKTVNKVNSAPLSPGDTVSFAGGATFSGSLRPSRSGSASAPITYKTYGTGKASVGSVWMKSVSHLAFQNLKVDGASQAFSSSASGTGVTNVSFDGVEARNATFGFNAPSKLDQGWTIRNCVIDRIQDTGVHSWAADTKVYDCKLSNVGIGHASIDWSVHGMYIKGARFHARGNEIANSMDPTGQAISTRYRDAVIEQNYIHDSVGGIGYFRDDAGEGTTTIRRNRMANIAKSAIYIGVGNRAPGVGENFHIYNNTVVNTRSVNHQAFRWAGTGGKEFIFRNNAVQGYTGVLQYTTGVQHSNNVLGNLGVVNFVPQAGSRLIDAGTPMIKSPSVTLAAGCVAGTLSFCGSAPDVGAVEKG